MSGVTTQGGFLHRNAGVRFRGPIFETTPDEAAWVTKYLVSYQARHQKRVDPPAMHVQDKDGKVKV